MSTSVSVKGLAMIVQIFQTATGEAGIATQQYNTPGYPADAPWGHYAQAPNEIPVVCAYPQDLADRLSLPLCIDLGK